MSKKSTSNKPLTMLIDPNNEDQVLADQELNDHKFTNLSLHHRPRSFTLSSELQRYQSDLHPNHQPLTHSLSAKMAAAAPLKPIQPFGANSLATVSRDKPFASFDNDMLPPPQIDLIGQASTSKKSDASLTQEEKTESKAECAVCGDASGSVAKHYGVLACLGCKGFFRRALKKADQYECINNDNCKINQYERNSCRSCRLKKCLDSGMDPAAVRPDRDFTGKQHGIRLLNTTSNAKKPKISATQSTSPSQSTSSSKNDLKNDVKKESKVVDKDEVWKKLPVETRTMIMSLLNIEIKICRGDTQKDASHVYPLHIQTIREIIEDPAKLKGKRTEMRYEPYRMAKNEELHVIVYRRLIAAIDWVECLSEMMNGLKVEDKIVLVKSCFGPLMLFKNAARTAAVTKDENILCVCNFAYVPRNMGNAYTDSYHLDNGLVGRMLDELVSPLRKLDVSETELVCMSAIIVLNSMARDLSEEATDKVIELRNKIQDALYQYVKEVYAEHSPTTRFGNLLLYIPILTALSNIVSENLRFAQTFSSNGGIPLLTSLFGCFPVEPFLDNELKQPGVVLKKSVETQTDDPRKVQLRKKVKKRRLPQSFTSPAENDERPSAREFRLLQAPNTFTLIEMFDDRMNDDVAMNSQQLSPYEAKTISQHHGSAPQLYQQQSSHQQQQQPSQQQQFLNQNNNVQYHQHPSSSNGMFLAPPPPQSSQRFSPTQPQVPFQTIQQYLPQNPYHTISGYPSMSPSSGMPPIPSQFYDQTNNSFKVPTLLTTNQINRSQYLAAQTMMNNNNASLNG